MTWEEKLLALQALTPATLNIRGVSNWYLSVNAEIKNDIILSGLVGNGPTPQDAVEDAWDQISELPSNQYILPYGPKRTAYRWTGFMWKEIKE